jgi:hypothetical protein
MSRTKVRLKGEQAPTRRGTRAQWAGARYFKRHVRSVSQPGHDRAPDLLRRLEREVGALADALPKANPRIVRAKPRIVLTRAKPRNVLLRALLQTAIAAMAMAALMIAWQHLPSDARYTKTTVETISEAKEVTRLRALVKPEAERRQLQVWYQDSNLLLYHSPWRPQ